MRIRLKTFAFIVHIVRNNYFLTPTDKGLYRRFAQAKRVRASLSDPVVLIQGCQDYYFFGIFCEIVTSMRKTGTVEVHQYTIRDLRGGSSLSLRRMFWNFITVNFFSDWKWRRLYSAVADRVAFATSAWLAPWTELRLWWSAWRIWRSIKTVDELAALTARNILIGDLIIDSYIRFKPAPALTLDNLYLLVIIRQALKSLEHAFQYFSSARPTLLLTSYTTYIQHGIPVRVAACLGIRVLAFANVQQIATEVTSDNVWQTKNGENYKRDFLLLPGQAARIANAEKILDNRLKGVIDKETLYMKTSAYGQESDEVLDVKDMPVIFLHDFFDSVHIYRWVTFHDFWTWVCFTIDTLQGAGIPFAIKAHPNQVADSSSALNLLIEKYPGLNVIPAHVSNKQLVRSGMTSAITVFGTVASEMAFMGVPTISCGDNPHISFDFCHTARTRAEYADLLRKHGALAAPLEEMRAESCAFYYMHALDYAERDQTLCNNAAALRRKIFYADAPPPLSEIIEALEHFSSGGEFEIFCRELLLPVKALDAR